MLNVVDKLPTFNKIGYLNIKAVMIHEVMDMNFDLIEAKINV